MLLELTREGAIITTEVFYTTTGDTSNQMRHPSDSYADPGVYEQLDLEERIKVIGRRYLWVIDFDGTAGDTFTDSPAGGNVEQNYEYTLDQIFGSRVLGTYRAQGGLRNRAPAEVISELHDAHDDVPELAYRHLQANGDELRSVMKTTVANLDVWEVDPLTAATEVYIRQDLINSLGHIGLKHDDGEVWPRMCNGFGELWDAIHDLNHADLGFHIDTAVLSSGYTEYIELCFEAWGRPQPDIWVTDDQIRGRKYPKDIRARVKPATFGLALVHQLWLQRYGLSGHAFWSQKFPSQDSPKWLDIALEPRSRISCWGDSLSKDGALAKAGRVSFGHFNPEAKDLEPNKYLSFSDWRDISDILRSNIPALTAGAPIAHILGIID